MKKATFSLIVVVLAFSMLACSLVTKILNPDREPENTPAGYTPEPDTRRLSFSPNALPNGRVGEEYRVVISLSGQRTPAFRMDTGEDSLPPGLSGTFDKEKQTYTIEGTPTQAGAYAFSVSASCYGTMVPGQTGSKEYSLLITPG